MPYSRGLLRDCEIFSNLRIDFVSSSNDCPAITKYQSGVRHSPAVPVAADAAVGHRDWRGDAGVLCSVVIRCP